MFSAIARRQASRFSPGRSLTRFVSTTSSSSSSSSSLPKFLRIFSLASTIAAASYAAGSLYPPTFATYISPRLAPPPPDPNAPSSIAYTQSLEETLQSLPALSSLRSQPDADEWYETRPYIQLPEERRANSLTAGALRGPGKLALAPLVRARRDESESVIFLHVGRGLCGHEGIVHGGLLATLLDETLGRIAIRNLPDKVGVTANLNLNYRAPTRADQFIVIKTRVVELKGRKALVAGSIEDLQGNVLVEATSLFVQPRYAKLLNTAHLEKVMGEPPQPQPKATLPIADVSMTNQKAVSS